jgi:hypothetical protein
MMAYNAPIMLKPKSKRDSKQSKTPSFLTSKEKGVKLLKPFLSFFRWANTKIAKVNALVVINKGDVDSGVEMPIAGYKVFANKPVNMRKTTLRLTERKDITAML